jgi:hypothetical protein
MTLGFDHNHKAPIGPCDKEAWWRLVANMSLKGPNQFVAALRL